MSSKPTNTRITRSRSSSNSRRHQATNNETAPNKTTKRKVHSISPKSPQQQAKKSSKMLSIEDIRTLMEQQTELIQSTIKSTVQSEVKALGEEIKSSLQNELSQIHGRIDSIQEQVNSELTSIRSNVNSCLEKYNNNDDDFIRLGKHNELKLNGIAHSNNENLHEIFCNIAKLIGYDIAVQTHIPDLTRTFKRNRTTSDLLPLPTIILKFVAKHIRDNFYGLYLTRVMKKPITTDDIGLPQGGRVLIGENLTQKNQSIFIAAMNLKKENKLMRVFTHDGLVQIKSKSIDKPTTIRSQRELDIFVENIDPMIPPANTNSTHQPVVNNGQSTSNPNSLTNAGASGFATTNTTHTTTNNQTQMDL